jgi:hypothetical protein
MPISRHTTTVHHNVVLRPYSEVYGKREVSWDEKGCVYKIGTLQDVVKMKYKNIP